jgi:hypothetical protein
LGFSTQTQKPEKPFELPKKTKPPKTFTSINFKTLGNNPKKKNEKNPNTRKKKTSKSLKRYVKSKSGKNKSP